MRFNSSRSLIMTSTMTSTIESTANIFPSKALVLIYFVVMPILLYCFVFCFVLLTFCFCLRKYREIRLRHSPPSIESSQPPALCFNQPQSSETGQPPALCFNQPQSSETGQPQSSESSQPPESFSSRHPPAIGSSQPQRVNAWQQNRYSFRPRINEFWIRAGKNIDDFEISDSCAYIDSDNRSDITYGKSENYAPSSRDSLQTDDYEPM